MVHAGHGGREGADDRIVELVHEYPRRTASLDYTSDAKTRTRLRALGTPVMSSGTLLKQIATVSDSMEPADTGHRLGAPDGANEGDTTQPESERSYAPPKPGIAGFMR